MVVAMPTSIAMAGWPAITHVDIAAAYQEPAALAVAHVATTVIALK
jgi:hypothetical protein